MFSASRKIVAVIVGVAVLAILGIGGAVALSIRSGDRPAHTSADGNAAGVSPTDLEASRAADAARADRGELRPTDLPSSAPPSVAPSSSPSHKPSTSASKSTKPVSTTVSSKGSCRASFYETGSTTANGEHFNPDGITAANKTLPFNTMVRVTNRANGKSVVVRINDRGPFVPDRCLDLSRGAFKLIASLSAGVLTVDFEVLA
jgi:rare lipoprotein A